MSATNHTQNYDLSQFVGGDIPSWLGDYNGDMGKIDAAIATVASGAGDTASEVNSLKSRMTAAEADIDAAESNIATLQSTTSTQGAAITQNANNITTTNNNVSALDTRVTALENSTDLDFDLSAHTGAAVLTSQNTLDSSSSVNYLLNEDSSIGKIYGGLFLSNIASLVEGDNVIANIAIADLPTYAAAFDITVGYAPLFATLNGNLISYQRVKFRFKTDKSIDVVLNSAYVVSQSFNVTIDLVPCILFLKDLGD